MEKVNFNNEKEKQGIRSDIKEEVREMLGDHTNHEKIESKTVYSFEDFQKELKSLKEDFYEVTTRDWVSDNEAETNYITMSLGEILEKVDGENCAYVEIHNHRNSQTDNRVPVLLWQIAG